MYITLSAILQPQGSILQYGFLGGGQYKKSLKKWGFIQENPQKLDFSDKMGLYSRVGQQYRGLGSLPKHKI